MDEEGAMNIISTFEDMDRINKLKSFEVRFFSAAVIAAIKVNEARQGGVKDE
uniref:Uncharacterized protein n=1 Tax=viral metagenome TaxID=1070528 RepID=A0A6H1ZIL2_9ZZZZ